MDGFIPFHAGEVVPLPVQGGILDQVHIFQEDDVNAINAALAAGRPLLVRGEPGSGKSQLARAAAKILDRSFVSFVVDSQTESRDLLWRVDEVARLGEAQLVGAVRYEVKEEADIAAREAQVRERLAIRRFVRPGPLWLAFDYSGALAQAEASGQAIPTTGGEDQWKNGCVLLIDEIDKAEAEVPNGLLEALGSGEFTPPGGLRTVKADGVRPLVVITSNDERALPEAFLRRCLVHRLDLPKGEEALRERLDEIGAAHFPGAGKAVLSEAAAMLISDREKALGLGRGKPGQAEYLDILRAVMAMHPSDPDARLEALRRVRRFTLGKHDDSPRT